MPLRIERQRRAERHRFRLVAATARPLTGWLSPTWTAAQHLHRLARVHCPSASPHAAPVFLHEPRDEHLVGEPIIDRVRSPAGALLDRARRDDHAVMHG
jgi:hypothetical protein